MEARAQTHAGARGRSAEQWGGAARKGGVDGQRPQASLQATGVPAWTEGVVTDAGAGVSMQRAGDGDGDAVERGAGAARRQRGRRRLDAEVGAQGRGCCARGWGVDADGDGGAGDTIGATESAQANGRSRRSVSCSTMRP